MPYYSIVLCYSMVLGKSTSWTQRFTMYPDWQSDPDYLIVHENYVIAIISNSDSSFPTDLRQLLGCPKHFAESPATFCRLGTMKQYDQPFEAFW